MEDNIAISVKSISKKYRLQQPVKDANGNETHDLWALKDISFDIKKGESVGIIGSNGSGKSTLLKILAGVTKPSTGSAEIKGRLASILDIGAGFHPELSGRENVFLNGQIYGFSHREIKQKYIEIVEFSGIGKFIDEPVKNYSNGMYLRLAFSIMAHLDFDVYLFDEVFSVGDAEFNIKAREKLYELMSSNKTCVLVSHNMADIRNQDTYMLLEKGQMKEYSREGNIIFNYLESSLMGSFIPVTNNVILTDFSKFAASEDLKVLKIELKQEGKEEFRTDRPFIFNVEFEKINESTTIDLFLRIDDIQGNIILTSTPLMSGATSDKGKGIYSFICIFPPFLFGFQTYRVSLYFVKNTLNKLQSTGNSLDSVEDREDRIADSAFRMDNVLAFKPYFKLGIADFNLSGLNLNGGLFPVFDWELNFQPNA